MSPLRAGVFWSSPATVPDDDLDTAVRASGWTQARLAGADASSRREVLVAMGAALGFPDWYGANLDALWDCLRDLTEPVVLVWDDWSRAAEGDPDGFAAVLRVLRARASEAGDLTVLLRGDGPDLDPHLGITALD